MGNILIVNDEEDICWALQRILKDEGYNVTTAVNSSEVKELIKKENFHSVIVELLLREEDGFQILETVQELDADMPLIMLIDSQQENIAVQALEMGAYDYITKPLVFTDIIKIVSKAVEKRQVLVEKIKAEKELALISHKFNCLINIIESFSCTKNEQEAADKLLESIIKHYSAGYSSISLLEDNKTHIKIIAAKSKFEGIAQYEIGKDYSLDVFPITSQVFETKKPVVEIGIIDLSSPISAKLKAETGKKIYCSFMEIPILYFGNVIGVLSNKFYDTEIRTFSDSEIRLAETIGSYIGLAVDNIRLRMKG